MNRLILNEELSKQIDKIKNKTHKIVLVGGCFDILHFGHICFLKAAKKLGTVIVALESDTMLKKHKGPLRPIHSQNERAEMLSNLKTVDYIILLPYFSTDEEYKKLTQLISPDIIAVTQGDDQIGIKTQHAQEVGAKIVVIPKIQTPSTTQLTKLLELDV